MFWVDGDSTELILFQCHLLGQNCFQTLRTLFRPQDAISLPSASHIFVCFAYDLLCFVQGVKIF